MYLDSLQQNYNKTEATPVAYYNNKTSTLYSPDLKQWKELKDINPIRVQFDPFVFDDPLK